MRCSWLLLLAFYAVSVLQSAEWIRVGSPNFELYTTVPEEEAQGILRNFEHAREFFLTSKLFVVPPHLPVVLIAFGTEREYKPYAPKAFTPAYYTSDGHRDYVVMSDLGEKHARVAIHEYLHVLVQHSGLDAPLWLNEGLAEVYSAMKTRADGKVLIGDIPDDRAVALAGGNWMRLGPLLNATAASPEYNDLSRSAMFYAQSCLLVHMLMLGEEYSAEFPEFLARIRHSDDSQKLLGEVYGKSAGELEKEMLTYFRQTHIGGRTHTAPLAQVVVEPAKRASDLEMELHLASLVGNLGRLEEAQDRLGRLAAAHPEDRRIDEAQAYIALASGDRVSAMQKLEQLISRGEVSSWKTYWDYALLLHQAKTPDRMNLIEILHTALERRPDLAPARLMLARELYSVGRRSQALTELRQIRQVGLREAVPMYRLMAQSALELGQLEDARGYAHKARLHAKTASDVAAVENLLRRLDGESPDARAAVEADEDKRPVLRRRAVPKTGSRKR